MSDADELLKDILNDEHFNLLDRDPEDGELNCFDTTLSDWKPITNDEYGIKEVVVGSSSSAYSDSGLSSDQVSPGKTKKKNCRIFYFFCVKNNF